MKSNEIIKLGESLGLEFVEHTNFKDRLNKDIVVFDGCNGQRFLIDGKWTKKEIYKELGNSLILLGQRQLKMKLNNLLSVNNDL